MKFVTPITKQPLLQKDYETLACQESAVEYKRINGIWRMIAAERQPLFEQFVREYETVRLAEGRQAADPDFYRQLPTTSDRHPAADMWRQRAHSYQIFLDSILSKMENNADKQLNILDLGAGNGWLSNRLAGRGHQVAAVDLTINEFDGLGVHSAYTQAFTAVQAEFDHLPFDDNQFDLIIFNASLHYSTDYTQSLAESIRTLPPGGRIAIIDTPVYQHADSGRKMVAERETQFSNQFGFKSDSLHSQNFLTHATIQALENDINRPFQTIPTVAPIRRAVRRVKTHLRGQRESAEFPILTFTTAGTAGDKR
ncbi:MAG: class I SAM-dependent methyltransferase [Anaerolineae bacterium]